MNQDNQSPHSPLLGLITGHSEMMNGCLFSITRVTEFVTLHVTHLAIVTHIRCHPCHVVEDTPGCSPHQ